MLTISLSDWLSLDCFPPDFVQTPFTHLENLLEPVLPYSLPGKDSSLEAIPKKLLSDAIEKIEKPAALTLQARDLLLKGDFQSVIAMEGELNTAPTTELADVIAWGYVSAGNEAISEVDTKSGEEADRLWAQAGEKYEAALKIQPHQTRDAQQFGECVRRTGSDQDRGRSGSTVGAGRGEV